MFLTRKEWIRIIIRNCVLFFLGVLCYALALWSWMSGEEEVALPVCGAVAIFFGIIGFPLGRYAKGVSPLLMAARKTIYFELCPAKFIFLYKQKENNPDNIVARPNMDVVFMLYLAYGAFGDTENAIKTVELLLQTAPARKKGIATAVNISLLYNLGKKEEAERLLTTLQSGKMNANTKKYLQVMLQTDRAMALGDWKAPEAYFNQVLTWPPRKLPPFLAVSAHYALATICEKTERLDETKMHYIYCAQYGGQTKMQQNAAEWLKDR